MLTFDSNQSSTQFRDSMEALVVNYIATPNPSWSNETFATYFCGNLSAETKQFSWNRPNNHTVRFLIPDCFFDSTATLTNFAGNQFILMGSTQYPDPLVRLGTAFPSLTSLIFQYGSLLNADGSPYLCDWTNAFNALPALSDVRIISVPFNCPLPSTLPSNIFSFALTDAGITGTIPSGLLSARTTTFSYTVDLSSNRLQGTIPSSLLSGIPLEYSGLSALELSLYKNNLTGSIPEDLFGNRSFAGTVLDLNFSNNKLNGSAGAWMTQFRTGGKLASFKVNLSRNQLSGSTSSNWFPSVFSDSWVWLMSDNQVTGDIADLFSDRRFVSSCYFYFSAVNNALTGSIPASLLPSNVSCYSILFYLSNNQISGALPSDLFSAVNWTATRSLSLYLDHNLLTGGLPSTLLGSQGTPQLGGLFLALNDNPKMNGSIPSTFLDSINPTASYSSNLLTLIELNFGYTELTGTLAIPNFGARRTSQPTDLSLMLPNADFRRISIEPNAGAILSFLDVSNNDLLTGTLPSDFFLSPSKVSTLMAGNTALGGMLPNISGKAFKSLDLSGTYIDFCSTSVWSLTSAQSCKLDRTNAHQCSAYYGTCSTSEPVSTPATTVSCPTETRPSLDYICIGSTWTFYGNVTTPTLTIPGSGTPTTVIGTVESSSIILGKGSTLIIQNGCASNLSQVTIVLEPSDLESIDKSTQTLISIDANSTCANLSDITIATTLKGTSCKSVTVSRTGSTPSQLVALFSINSSGCNNGRASKTWWIVVIAVLVPVVALVLIIILLVILVRPIRECIMPYSKKRKAGNLQRDV